MSALSFFIQYNKTINLSQYTKKKSSNDLTMLSQTLLVFL